MAWDVRDGRSCLELGPVGPTTEHLDRSGDLVEAALARALTDASSAGRWDVVAQLGRELEARRLAGSNVVPLPKERGVR